MHEHILDAGLNPNPEHLLPPMPEHILDDEARFRLLGLLTDNPALSQRQLAGELGISLGKVNYCLNALLDRGYVKAMNFKNSNNKRGYLYQLTPTGISAKARAAKRFLARKQIEYERLAQEIEALRQETSKQTNAA